MLINLLSWWRNIFRSEAKLSEVGDAFERGSQIYRPSPIFYGNTKSANSRYRPAARRVSRQVDTCRLASVVDAPLRRGPAPYHEGDTERDAGPDYFRDRRQPTRDAGQWY